MHEQKTWQFVIPASLTANGMDSFSSIGILLQTKPKKWNTRNTRCGQNNGEIDAKSSRSDGVSRWLWACIGSPFFFFFFKANANAVSLKKQKLQYALVHCQRGWDGMGLWPHVPYPSLVFTGDFSTVLAAVFTSVIVHESARNKNKTRRAWSASWLIEARGAG